MPYAGTNVTTHCYHVYILASKKHGMLYIGVTNDLARRILEHKSGAIAGFSKKFHINKLVYTEKFDYIDQAIHREKCLKRWKRDGRLN